MPPVPLLIGTTRDEHKLYQPPDRPSLDRHDLEREVAGWLPRRARHRAAEVIDVYRRSRRTRSLAASPHDLVDAVATASRFRMPAIRLAEAHRPHQSRTFLYQFDWESPARGGALGACHGLEVPFVFGTVGRNGNERLSGTGPAADRLSHHMMDAWIAFARTGEPGHDGIGPWPAYHPDERNTLVFGPECGLETAPFEEERAIWSELISAPPQPVEV